MTDLVALEFGKAELARIDIEDLLTPSGDQFDILIVDAANVGIASARFTLASGAGGERVLAANSPQMTITRTAVPALAYVQTYPGGSLIGKLTVGAVGSGANVILGDGWQPGTALVAGQNIRMGNARLVVRVADAGAPSLPAPAEARPPYMPANRTVSGRYGTPIALSFQAARDGSGWTGATLDNARYLLTEGDNLRFLRSGSVVTVANTEFAFADLPTHIDATVDSTFTQTFNIIASHDSELTAQKFTVQVFASNYGPDWIAPPAVSVDQGDQSATFALTVDNPNSLSFSVNFVSNNSRLRVAIDDGAGGYSTPLASGTLQPGDIGALLLDAAADCPTNGSVYVDFTITPGGDVIRLTPTVNAVVVDPPVVDPDPVPAGTMLVDWTEIKNYIPQSVRPTATAPVVVKRIDPPIYIYDSAYGRNLRAGDTITAANWNRPDTGDTNPPPAVRAGPLQTISSVEVREGDSGTMIFEIDGVDTEIDWVPHLSKPFVILPDIYVTPEDKLCQLHWGGVLGVWRVPKGGTVQMTAIGNKLVVCRDVSLLDGSPIEPLALNTNIAIGTQYCVRHSLSVGEQQTITFTIRAGTQVNTQTQRVICVAEADRLRLPAEIKNPTLDMNARVMATLVKPFWRRLGGDFKDANGAHLGNVPFDTFTRTSGGSNGAVIAFNATAIISAGQTRTLVVTPIDGGGNNSIGLHTANATDVANRPRLVVTRAGGAVETIYPNWDVSFSRGYTTTSAGTYNLSQTVLTLISSGTGGHVRQAFWLNFTIPEGAAVTSAVLQLVGNASGSGAIKLGLYEADMRCQATGAKQAPTYATVAAYGSDIIWKATTEAEIRAVTGGVQPSIFTSNGAAYGGMADNASNYGSTNSGGPYGLGVEHVFDPTGALALTEAYASIWLYFDYSYLYPGNEITGKGGPGLICMNVDDPNYQIGGGGNPCKGADAFTARGQRYLTSGAAYAAYPEWRKAILFEDYTYHRGATGNNGDSFMPSHPVRCGQWNHVEMYVKFGDEGESNTVVARWLNGHKITQMDWSYMVRFIRTPDAPIFITKFWHDPFLGGIGQKFYPGVNNCYIEGVFQPVVSRVRLGPVSEASLPAAPTWIENTSGGNLTLNSTASSAVQGSDTFKPGQFYAWPSSGLAVPAGWTIRPNGPQF